MESLKKERKKIQVLPVDAVLLYSLHKAEVVRIVSVPCITPRKNARSIDKRSLQLAYLPHSRLKEFKEMILTMRVMAIMAEPTHYITNLDFPCVY